MLGPAFLSLIFEATITTMSLPSIHAARVGMQNNRLAHIFQAKYGTHSSTRSSSIQLWSSAAGMLMVRGVPGHSPWLQQIWCCCIAFTTQDLSQSSWLATVDCLAPLMLCDDNVHNSFMACLN
jgi:hypothetical protein